MKYLLISMILLCASTADAQYLSFDQLISLQSKDIEYINEFLTQKKWSFTGSEPETDKEYGKAEWALQTEFDYDEAYAWFKAYYSDGFESRLYYQVFNKVEYTKIKARITSLGMKRINSEIEVDRISSTYVGQSFAVKLTSSLTDKTATTRYSVNIYKKADYFALINTAKTTKGDDEVDVLYLALLDNAFKDEGNLWSSMNMGEAILLYKVPSTSKMAVINEGEVYNEVIVDGYRGFIYSDKIRRINNK